MSTPVQFLGIDPGVTTGIVLYRPGGEPLVAQCNHTAAAAVLAGILTYDVGTPVYAQVERFVVRGRAARSGHSKAGEITRTLIGQLREVWASQDSTSKGRLGGHWHERSAVQVKPWAIDERLDAVGLLAACKGMTHARDAARHSLFTAVRDGRMPDPLGRGDAVYPTEVGR